MLKLFLNISSLITVDTLGAGYLSGNEMNCINEIKNGAIYFSDKILWYGSTYQARILLSNNKITPEIIYDKKGCTVLPGFVDSHTHIVFAGDRSEEFGSRLRGATYQEIAESGGGILTTVKATRDASVDELAQNGIRLALSAMSYGTTSIEIKSGYSLTTDGEIKQLEAISKMKKLLPLHISATFLGAHDFPIEFSDKRDEYVDLLCQEMIPKVKGLNLAEFCDIFIDDGYYTYQQGEKILSTAKDIGFKLKVHADELSDQSAALLAGKLNAQSADHLLFVNENSINELKKSNTVACLLPGTAYFIRMPYANARKLIDNGLTVALATDTNPGSCFTENMQMILSLAVINMKMTAEEAIAAATINGAKALDIQDTKGSIENGKDADFIVLNTPSYIDMFYHFGINHVEQVWINGNQILIDNFMGNKNDL